MADLVKHGVFNQDDLVLVPPPKNPVMLKSGGPIMSAVEEKDGKVLCVWDDGRYWWPHECLYSCVPYRSEVNDVQKS